MNHAYTDISSRVFIAQVESVNWYREGNKRGSSDFINYSREELIVFQLNNREITMYVVTIYRESSFIVRNRCIVSK